MIFRSSIPYLAVCFGLITLDLGCSSLMHKITEKKSDPVEEETSAASAGSLKQPIVGAIDRDGVDLAIKKHRNEFRSCYERVVNNGHPEVRGKIVVKYLIQANGHVSDLVIQKTTMKNTEVEQCVANVFARIQFPLPAGGVPVTITYPLNFDNPKST